MIGAVAQLGERIVRNDEVGGSNPPSSTKSHRAYCPGNLGLSSSVENALISHLRVAARDGVARRIGWRRGRMPTAEDGTQLSQTQLFGFIFGFFGRILLAVTHIALLECSVHVHESYVLRV